MDSNVHACGYDTIVHYIATICTSDEVCSIKIVRSNPPKGAPGKREGLPTTRTLRCQPESEFLMVSTTTRDSYAATGASEPTTKASQKLPVASVLDSPWGCPQNKLGTAPKTHGGAQFDLWTPPRQ